MIRQRSEKFVEIVKEAKLGRIKRDVIAARELLDPLDAEMLFDVARDGLKVEIAVAASGVAAIDEAESAFGVDQQIVECGVAMSDDDVVRDARSVRREPSINLKR